MAAEADIYRHMRSKSPDPRRLSVSAVREHLRSNWIAGELHCFDALDSTNTTARELARAGAVDGTVVIAEKQRRGRGRLGRSWVSPAYKNLYVSVVLRTALYLESDLQISLMAGVATCETVREWHEATIKWPNDVLIGGRKVAGILAEMEGVGEDRFVVLGIGVNLNAEVGDYPEEVRDKAISLRMAVGEPVDRARVAGRLLTLLEQRYEQLLREGFEPIARAWRVDSGMIGRVIRVGEPGGEVSGEVIDVDADGALRLLLASGATYRVVAGDVTVVGGYERGAAAGAV